MQVEEGACQTGQEDLGFIAFAIALGFVRKLNPGPPIAGEEDEDRGVGKPRLDPRPGRISVVPHGRGRRTGAHSGGDLVLDGLVFDHHELPGLAVEPRRSPARDLDHLLDVAVGNGIWPEVADASSLLDQRKELVVSTFGVHRHPLGKSGCLLKDIADGNETLCAKRESAEREVDESVVVDLFALTGIRASPAVRRVGYPVLSPPFATKRPHSPDSKCSKTAQYRGPFILNR